MASSRQTGWILLPALLVACVVATPPAAAIDPTPPNSLWNCCRSIDPETGVERIDAACFFDLLVDRYQRLSQYEDVADVHQTTQRTGAPPSRVRTRIGCAIVDGNLRVRTPTSSLWRLGRLGRNVKRSAVMDDALLDYNLWLAPHMALKYTEHPKKEFRTGVDEGFTATEAESVTIGTRPMVHLELTSGDGASGDHRARFDLYVNPESMLVEQITGHQRLPDGASYETTLTITPTNVVDAEADTGDGLTSSPADTFDDGGMGVQAEQEPDAPAVIMPDAEPQMPLGAMPPA